MKQISIVGGGLAGCEAALYLAGQGIAVKLIEQKPAQKSAAHKLDGLAELVCSTSLKSLREDTASGLLKSELRLLGSCLLPLADRAAVPAGAALAVDAAFFSRLVTEAVEANPNIEVCRQEAKRIPDERPCIIAAGPLCSAALSADIENHFSTERLSFYDAIAPSVTHDSIDPAHCFKSSRYGKGSDDYINAPLGKDEYAALVDGLTAAEVVPPHDFEQEVPYFESCLPVEVIAARGPDTLRFGTLRPVGLEDPRTGRRPWAVLQLRRENREGGIWGLVGCQTRLRHGAQKRVFGLIPALANAEYVRYGSMHRNFFLDYPSTLDSFQQSRHSPGLYFAGQMTGVEGYVESLGSGLLAARNLAAVLQGLVAELPPRDTITGALAAFLIEQQVGKSQPMNASFGLLPSLAGPRMSKARRKLAYAERSLASLRSWLGGQRL